MYADLLFADYVKATFPLVRSIVLIRACLSRLSQSWALNSICWGALEYAAGYQAANQTAYLDSTLRWGLDWLIKAHPSNNTLYVYVGDSERDNNYWGGDQNIPTPRPAYQVNDTHPGTDVAASTAAAFASCSLLYSNRTLSNTSSIPPALFNRTYATTLLTHAQQLFSFAANATGGIQRYQDAVPEVASSYPSTSYFDDLAMASLFLGIAENSTSHIQAANDYWDRGALSRSTLAVDWDSKAAAIPVLMTQVLAASSTLAAAQDSAMWKEIAEGTLDRIVEAEGSGHLTDGGLLYFDGSSTLASLNPALNLAMLLVKYAPLASSSEKANSYLVS